MPKLRALSLFLSLLFVSFASLTYAQSDAELIAYSDGDLWSWSADGQTEQLTFWGYNGGPILSPDGTKIAFLSYDGTVGEQIQAGQIDTGYGALPSNIWVMDTATHEFQWINDQSGAGEGGILRSYPTWSPDSTRLAVVSDHEGTSWVYVISADGSALQRVTSDSGFVSSPAWFP